MLGVLHITLLAWLLFAVSISLLVAALYPFVRPRIATLSPAVRAVVLRGVNLLPIVGGLALTLLCFMPTAVGLVFPGFDHCPSHGQSHLHLCLTHLPGYTGALPGWILVAGFGSVFIARSMALLLRFAESHRLLGQLVGTATFDSDTQAWIVDSSAAFAMTTGIVQKKTLLSRGLARALPARLIGAVVAHEHAHERRNDGFWKLVTAVLSLAHLSATRSALLADIEFACEQACDEEAGVELGDRILVAEALLAVHRVRQHVPALGLAAVSFGARGVRGRVESLLASGNLVTWRPGAIRGALLASGLVLLAVAEPMHHLAETIVGLLPR